MPRHRALCFALLATVSVAACGSSEDGDKGSAGAAGAAGSAAGAAGNGGTAGAGAGGGTAGSGGTVAGGGTAGSGGAAQTSLKFVAFGDCGKGNAGQYAVGAAVAQKCQQSGCDFVQLLGDNFYESGVSSVTDPQWQDKFEKPYANVNAPFWVVLGNHDYGGNGGGWEPAKADIQVQYTAASTKWKLPARYYHHPEAAHGVDFFALDTNAAMFSNHAQQKKDMAAWLAQSTATWKVAFGHHPYLSNGPHGNAGTYEGIPLIPILSGGGVKDLMDTTICSKVDVYISAHDHSKQWLTPTCNGTELIVSGGGASTTELKGKNPSYFQNLKTGFLYVEISGKSFKGEFYDETGALEYTRTLTKP